MKTRTLLFGAGQGSLVYIKNNCEQREFVGYVDNDTQKIGKVFDGIMVYSPEKLHNLIFDEIVITTQWAMEVKKQLIDEFNIPPQKVIVPKKNQLKNLRPFQNQHSLDLGRNIILQLNRLAQDCGAPLVVDFGTLLGLVRDGDIIPWDDDIDFSVPLEQGEETFELLSSFVKQNHEVQWRVERVTNKVGHTTGFLLKFTDSCRDITEFTTSICFRQNQDGKALHMPSLGMWYSPDKHFKSVAVISWNNAEIQVPYDYHEYLTFQYGDWKTPKKDISLEDYANLQEVDFGDIKDAGFKANTIKLSE